MSTTVLFSCAAAMREQLNLLKKIDTSVLKLGMTKLEVETALKKKPDNTVSAHKDPQTNAMMEVVQYRYLVDTDKTDRYWFYFTDDKLERWELGRPEHNHVKD
jgi:hypothetical protein